jgi:hypothetical protein
MAGGAAVLSGCSTELATRAPRGVDLGGEWQIDLALSDFPEEAVPAQSPIIGGTTDSGSGQPGGRGHGGRRGTGGAGGAPMAGGPGGGRGSSLEHHFAMPPHLSISQTARVFTVDITMPDGKHVTNSYTAGEKSVVTTTRGEANRTLGWDGDGFLIRTQVGEKGPQSDVRYALEHDGTLSVTSTITRSGIYDFQYTLEYDRPTP